MIIKGIDVSRWQGKPDWKAVKKSGIQVAILNMLSKKADPEFEYNYQKCIENKISVGAYVYSYAKNPQEAQSEAAAAIKILSGKHMDYPVFYDLEWEEMALSGKTVIADIAETFLQAMSSAGYKTGIYCNVHWYNTYIADRLKEKYEFWIASVPAKDEGLMVDRLKPSYGIGWQYSWKGKVDGIKGDVDLNVFYKDYKDQTDDETESGLKNPEILQIDGVFGRSCVRRSQQWAKTQVDGVISFQPLSNKKYLSAAAADCWNFLSSGYGDGSSFIRALQKVLKEKGFYVKNIDGWCGRETVSAWQKWLKSETYYNGEIDGSMGPLHVMAWQRYLNKH